MGSHVFPIPIPPIWTVLKTAAVCRPPPEIQVSLTQGAVGVRRFRNSLKVQPESGNTDAGDRDVQMLKSPKGKEMD